MGTLQCDESVAMAILGVVEAKEPVKIDEINEELEYDREKIRAAVSEMYGHELSVLPDWSYRRKRRSPDRF